MALRFFILSCKPWSQSLVQWVTNHTIRSWCLFHRNSTHLLCMDLCDALNLLDIFSVMELNQNFLFMGKVTVAENLWLTPKQTRIFSSTCWCSAFFLLGCNLGEYRVAQKGFPYYLRYQSPALQEAQQYFSECLQNRLHLHYRRGVLVL